MNEDKRYNRGYKVKDSFYDKAMKRAKKADGTLANLLENVVIAYSYGMNIVATSGSSELPCLDKVGSDAVVEVAKKKAKQ